MSAQSLLRDSSCAQNTAHKSLPTQKNTKLYGRHRTPYNLVFIWCFNLQNGQLRKVTIHIFERHKSPQYRTFRNFRLRYGSDKLLLEKENIDTLDSKGEVLLTILSSLAQDESRSISENSTWGIRRRFEQGKVTVNHKKFLGYDKDEEGNLVINEKQAKIIRRIYVDFLNGKGPNRIARELEEEGVQTWNGKTKWYESTIRKMLLNEKYKGDALLQKTYTVDFLTKKRVENNGEVPQYYVEESHPAIIDKDTWKAVQLEMERRRKFCEEHGIKKMYSSTTDNPFAGKIICGKCGRAYGRKVWNSTDDGLRRIVWRCNGKYTEKGKVGCDNRHVDDEVFYKAFVEAYNVVVENREHFMAKWKEQIESNDLLKKVTAKRFIGIFKEAAEIDKFDMELFFKLMVKIIVLDEGLLVVSLLDGTEIEIENE